MSQSVLSRFLAILSSRVVGLLTVFLATPVIVRVLGRSSYGDYAFLLSVLGVGMLFVDVGIFDGLRKFLAESDRPPEWPHQVFAFYTRFAVALAATVVGGVFLTVETGLVGEYLGQRFELNFLLLGLLIFVRQVAALARSALMGLDRERVSETLQIVNKIAFVVIGLGLLINGHGIPGLLIGRILGHAVMAVVGLAVASSEMDLAYLTRRLPSSFPRRTLLRFNVGSFVFFALYVSILHLDVLLIQTFRGSTATGTYRAALTIAELIWFAPRVLQVALLHSTSKLWSDDAYDEITDLSARLTRYTLLFTTLLVIGLASLAEPFMTLYYGPEFVDAVLPLLILLPGALGFAVARPIFAIGQGNGDLRELNYATGGAAVINFVGNLVLIPRLGIHGAAIATTISYLSMLVFHLWSARVIGFNPTSDLRLPRIALTAVVSTALIFLLASTIRPDYLALLIVPPIGFAIYASMSVISGVIDSSELQLVRKYVR